MYRTLIAVIIFVLSTFALQSQSLAQQSPLQSILQDNNAAVVKASRKTIDPVLNALTASGLENVQLLLENWRQKNLWQRKSDAVFFYVNNPKTKPIELIDIDTGKIAGTVNKKELKQLKPNSGVRSIIGATLVRFQLIDPDRAKRQLALTAIARDSEASHLDVLRATISNENDTQIKAQMLRLEKLLTIQFDKDTEKRVSTINSFSGDTDVDFRAVLNPILSVKSAVNKTIPENKNIVRVLKIGSDLSEDDAYKMLVRAKFSPESISKEIRDKALIQNIRNGKIAGINVGTLDTDAKRDDAYSALRKTGDVAALVTEKEITEAVNSHVFYEVYTEQSKDLTNAAQEALAAINTKVELLKMFDLFLDGLSLASIYFLAAIGLAITFGVMRVINMAHGEFIMIGAYTGYVVQQFIPNYTVSIIVALPLAFCIAFAAGVALERLVIRHLMHRPLETLLATFGISIALQQLAKNIFGTQARPLTSPAWLDGALVVNDIVSISYIRIAIFVLAILFLGLLLFILNKTRLGLEVRAVTQNPRMASSMGINPDKINMLTFGLGSGIAGIAGVAIGLFAKVTSELGSAYIVQSFMTVVVGGVGNIWGALAGAGMIGGLQKIIEFFNPSNTLAAQTYMIIFIIIFIQFRPKGIIALKGRAAGD